MQGATLVEPMLAVAGARVERGALRVDLPARSWNVVRLRHAV
jgi:hypothetical protein